MQRIEADHRKPLRPCTRLGHCINQHCRTDPFKGILILRALDGTQCNLDRWVTRAAPATGDLDFLPSVEPRIDGPRTRADQRESDR